LRLLIICFRYFFLRPKKVLASGLLELYLRCFFRDLSLRPLINNLLPWAVRTCLLVVSFRLSKIFLSSNPYSWFSHIFLNSTKNFSIPNLMFLLFLKRTFSFYLMRTIIYMQMLLLIQLLVTIPRFVWCKTFRSLLLGLHISVLYLLNSSLRC